MDSTVYMCHLSYTNINRMISFCTIPFMFTVPVSRYDGQNIDKQLVCFCHGTMQSCSV
jgi:hypothetical protein